MSNEELIRRHEATRARRSTLSARFAVPVGKDTVEKASIRQQCFQAATFINAWCPDSPERDAAFDLLVQAATVAQESLP